MEGLTGKSLAFVGDCQNNVTYDLMRSGALMGLDVRIAGPTGFEWRSSRQCSRMRVPDEGARRHGHSPKNGRRGRSWGGYCLRGLVDVLWY